MKELLTAEGLRAFLNRNSACGPAKQWADGKTLAEAVEDLPNVPDLDRAAWTYWFMRRVSDLLLIRMEHLALWRTANGILRTYGDNMDQNQTAFLDEIVEIDEEFTDATLFSAPGDSVYEDAYLQHVEKSQKARAWRNARREVLMNAFVVEVTDFMVERFIPFLEAQDE